MACAEAYFCTKWHLDPSSHLATTVMGRKVGEGCVPFLGGKGAGSLSNTMSPGLRPTSTPSGILIHLTVLPQYTNIRQTGQDTTDNSLIAQSKLFYKQSPQKNNASKKPSLNVIATFLADREFKLVVTYLQFPIQVVSFLATVP